MKRCYEVTSRSLIQIIFIRLEKRFMKLLVDGPIHMSGLHVLFHM